MMPFKGSVSRSARRISHGAHGTICSLFSTPPATSLRIVPVLTPAYLAACPLAEKVRIWGGPLLAGDRMIPASGRHALLVPGCPLAGPAPQPAEHVCGL